MDDNEGVCYTSVDEFEKAYFPKYYAKKQFDKLGSKNDRGENVNIDGKNGGKK